MDGPAQPASTLPQPPTGTPAAQRPLTKWRLIFFNERELRAGWRLLMYSLMAIFVLAVLLGIAGLFARSVPGTITPAFIIVVEIASALAVLIPALVMARFESRTLADYGLPPRLAFGRNFWVGAAWGIAALTLLLLVLRINGSFLFGTVGLNWKAALWYGALWAVAMYLVGLFEEFMLRGYTQYTLTTGFRFLGPRIGFWAAAALLSLTFAGLHLTNEGETPLGIGSIVLIALFFCFTLYRTGNLWFAIGMHAGWNWGQTFLYGTPNSGIVAKGHLLNPVISGPAWYTGGTAGPEGSILIFPLIALLFVVFDRTFPQEDTLSGVGAP